MSFDSEVLRLTQQIAELISIGLEQRERIRELEQRERGYLSELADYGRTVATLRARVSELEQELADLDPRHIGGGE